jgi:hypothetical protein
VAVHGGRRQPGLLEVRPQRLRVPEAHPVPGAR